MSNTTPWGRGRNKFINMKKFLLLTSFFALFTVVSAQSPYVTYEPTPSINQSNQDEKETTRVSGYVKDLSGVRKVSLKVSFKTDSYGKEIVTVVKILEQQSSYYSTYGSNTWKTVNARAYYCNDNCDFTFYASYNGGYIFFDN